MRRVNPKDLGGCARTSVVYIIPFVPGDFLTSLSGFSGSLSYSLLFSPFLVLWAQAKLWLTAPFNVSGGNSSTPTAAIIAPAVVGGILVALAFVAFAFFLHRRRHKVCCPSFSARG